MAGDGRETGVRFGCKGGGGGGCGLDGRAAGVLRVGARCPVRAKNDGQRLTL